MTLQELITLIGGRLLAGDGDPNRAIRGGCGADLMSDVLASIEPGAVLLTGLCTAQVIRTAQMADVAAVVIVRGKTPPADMIALAEQEHVPLISSQSGTFELCGRLHRAGLPSLEFKFAE
jgi:predicted transcriptional regulator